MVEQLEVGLTSETLSTGSLTDPTLPLPSSRPPHRIGGQQKWMLQMETNLRVLLMILDERWKLRESEIGVCGFESESLRVGLKQRSAELLVAKALRRSQSRP